MADSLISIENLSLGYGEREIFSGISVAEEGGNLVALVGSNGRGKSTLLRSIAGLEPIFSPPGKKCGRISFRGKELSDYSRRELGSLVSFVGTGSEKAEYLSVGDMVGLNAYFRTGWTGRPGEEEKRKIAEALELVGLKGFEKRDCRSLSDGEYQRATIAGAIVQESGIILLDEPTAFLDIANKFLITKMLKDISEKGKLIVFSTHDLRLAMQICGKLWVMAEDGFHSGTPQELADKGVMERIFSMPGVRFDRQTFSFVFGEETDGSGAAGRKESRTA